MAGQHQRAILRRAQALAEAFPNLKPFEDVMCSATMILSFALATNIVAHGFSDPVVTTSFGEIEGIARALPRVSGHTLRREAGSLHGS